jgi:hypothetical protein
MTSQVFWAVSGQLGNNSIFHGGSINARALRVPDYRADHDCNSNGHANNAKDKWPNRSILVPDHLPVAQFSIAPPEVAEHLFAVCTPVHVGAGCSTYAGDSETDSNSRKWFIHEHTKLLFILSVRRVPGE